MCLGLFHINFFGGVLFAEGKRGEGKEISILSADRTDVIYTQTLLHLILSGSSPWDGAFPGHPHKGSLLSPAPSKCSTHSWYFDRRSQLKNFRNKQLWENCVFITYFLDVFQLHNTNTRRNTPENNLFFPPTEKSILSINIGNDSHFVGAKINGFFSSYVLAFNLICTQTYV